MRILLCHPGASWATHDVFMGILDGLQTMRPIVQTSVFPLDLKLAVAERFLKAQWKFERRQGKDVRPPSPLDVQLQACDSIITRALVSRVDWVVIVTAMFVPPAIVQVLRMAGLRVAVVMTESPYDETQETLIGKAASLVFTNEKRTADRRGWIYLPHAWRKHVHEPDTPTSWRTARTVFVGSGFPERIAWLERFVRAGGAIDLFGVWEGVEDHSPLHRHIKSDVIDNGKAARLYQDYVCALNLYRTSKGWNGDTHISDGDAWSMNPRAYELAALGVPHVSSARGEVVERFAGIVPTTDDPAEAAVETERLTLMSPVERGALTRRLRAVVADDHWNIRIHTLVQGLNDAAA